MKATTTEKISWAIIGSTALNAVIGYSLIYNYRGEFLGHVGSGICGISALLAFGGLLLYTGAQIVKKYE